MGDIVEISRRVLDVIAAEAACAHPQEACGLLFGHKARIDAHEPCRNVAAQPESAFEIDPRQLIAAYRSEREGGAGIAGCYHSHPGGSASPSQRDVAAAAANGWIWVIVGKDGVGCWRAAIGGFEAIRFTAV